MQWGHFREKTNVTATGPRLIISLIARSSLGEPDVRCSVPVCLFWVLRLLWLWLLWLLLLLLRLLDWLLDRLAILYYRFSKYRKPR